MWKQCKGKSKEKHFLLLAHSVEDKFTLSLVKFGIAIMDRAEIWAMKPCKKLW